MNLKRHQFAGKGHTFPEQARSRLRNRAAGAASLLPLVLLLLVSAPATARAFYYAGFGFTLITNGVMITNYNGAGGAVTIPDSIMDRPVTSIGSGAFAYCASLASAAIGHGVINVDISTFEYCLSLTNIILGNRVSAIGSNAL